jgi:uncharacterized membrane protein YkoI
MNTHRQSDKKTRTRIWCWWLSILGIALMGSFGAASATDTKITMDQASQIALQEVPGKVTDVTIEKKRGRNVYVVEIVAEKDSAEVDVLVDLESGKVIGTER